MAKAPKIIAKRETVFSAVPPISSSADTINSEAAKPVIADQHVAVNASPAADVALEVAPAAPSLGAATGTISSIPPESDDQGGAGNTAGSAGSLTVNASAIWLDGGEAEFRARFPCLSTAIDAWEASGAPALTAVRIRSKTDGFRRAGIAHSKTPVEHQLDGFRSPEPLEALFAEPNLVVEFI
ncbi:HI1506-related protein [Mesorhizobium sp. M0965]|uniref:HI1506-related protein n=1 Tax=unclassified Mesorhizobium TaxID=325217 RepID=UPI00333AE76A